MRFFGNKVYTLSPERRESSRPQLPLPSGSRHVERRVQKKRYPDAHRVARACEEVDGQLAVDFRDVVRTPGEYHV